MSQPTHDDFDDFDELDNEQPDERQQQEDRKPGWRRQLEKRLRDLEKANQEATARAEKAERENAFAKAGVPLGDPLSRYFLAGYDGELTPEAIKAAAAEIGLVEAQPKQDGPAGPEGGSDGIPAEERQAHERVAAAAVGGSPNTGRDFAAEINAAQTPEEVLRIAKEAQVPLAPGVSA